MLNIPIYRAKKIDSDEYVIGYYFDGFLSIIKQYNNIILTANNERFDIDPLTLSIHFPDMIASDSNRLLPNGEKDLRIFASLSEDGKGGDKILLSNYLQWRDDKVEVVANYGGSVISGFNNCFFHKKFKPKIIGIQQ